MPIFDARDLLQYPTGNNASDTVIGDIHFNLTALQHWNYSLYDNGTLSNSSRCILTFEPYTPKLVYANGSFVNSTSCYTPINPIGQRAKIGIGFAVAFGLLLVPNLIALSKHGRMYLPAEKRFRPVGRRWQWYWTSLASVMALVSLFTNIDVDRYYIVELPIVLTSFFWYLMQMCTMAAVWEAVRHWGSWMERQYVDPNPFVFSLEDRRATIEFFIPLAFYLFWWLEFFMIVPRNWGAIELQRDTDQTVARAIPAATDARFKAAVFLIFISWCITVFSMRHTMQNYLPHQRGLVRRSIGFIRHIPLRFVLLLPITLAMIGYQALCAWKFDYSPLNVNGNRIAIYVGGYLPSLLVMLIQIIYGWVAPNEDRELIRQRRIRGEQNDRELGIVHKPAWWRRLNGDFTEGDMRDQIARNVREIGGGRATAKNIDRSIELRANETSEPVEMNDMATRARRNSLSSIRTAGSAAPSFPAYGGKSDRRRNERTVQAVASMLFPNAEPTVDRRAELMMDGPPPPYRDNDSTRGRTTGASSSNSRSTTLGRSTSVGTTTSVSGPPQQVRSMLDI